MSLTNFISEISRSDGLARNNRFSVLISPPDFITIDNQKLQLLNLFCDTAQLPGVNILTNQVRTYGEVREVPYEVSYEPVTMTFYVDKSLMVKRFFDEWLLGTHIGETRNHRYYKEYAKTIDVFVEDLEDKSVHLVTLYEAYPKNISAISLDYSAKDIMKVSVTFQYKYWKSTELDGQSTFAFDQRVPENVESYANNFFEYQQFINENLGNIFPEDIGEFTGVTPIFV